MIFDFFTFFIASSLMIIPILSLLLRSTGQILVQIGLLLAAQAAVTFAICSQLVGAVLWLTYVGAVCVLFLLTHVAIGPFENKKHEASCKKVNNRCMIISVILIAIQGAWMTYVEITDLVKRLSVLRPYVKLLEDSRANPLNYLDSNTILLQNIGFNENSDLYVISGLLLLVGMYIVIQTLVDKGIIANVSKKNNKK